MARPFRPEPPPGRGFLNDLFPVDPRQVVGGLYDLGARGVGRAIDTATGAPSSGDDFSQPTLGREAYQMLTSPTFGGGMSPAANMTLAAVPLALTAKVARTARVAKAAEEAAQTARAASPLDAVSAEARAASATPTVAETIAKRAEPAAAPARQPSRPVSATPPPDSLAEMAARRAERPDMAEARSLTDLPSLRRIPAAEGVEAARGDPHLFEGGASTPGAFVGGPPNVNSLADLHAMRERVYQRLADPAGRAFEGSTWYDRFRSDISRATGGDPNASTMMARTEALFSPQRAPPQELNLALKQTSEPIAGVPAAGGTPVQRQKYLTSVAANDPNLMAQGRKVSEYGYGVDPARALEPEASSATGVNDFRHLQELGYPKETGVGATQHQFADYETAQLVDRANRERLDNRSDWTGEQVQAALWVRQKAEDLLTARPNLVRDRIAAGMTPEEAYRDAYNNVTFPDANETLRESFPQHTLFATHEAQPGASIPAHMPGSVAATPEERQTFFDDPRSTWANAPGGRDALYAGLHPTSAPGAGMRVLESKPMTGVYTPPGTDIPETNPGMVGRPLVGFDTTASGEKTLTPADRTIIQGVESTRALVDAQNASAATKIWPVNTLKSSNAYFAPLDRPMTVAEIVAAKAASEQHQLPDVSDMGEGALFQNYETPPVFKPKERKAAEEALGAALPSAGTGYPVKAESVFVPYVDEDKNYWTGTGIEPLKTPWSQTAEPETPLHLQPGTGQATTKMLGDISATPELRRSITQNPYIPTNAGARVERDYDQTGTWGAPWEALQNTRKIIAGGGDWPAELEKALKVGVPATTAAGVALTPAAGLAQTPPQPIGTSPAYDDWWKRLQDQLFAQ